MTVSPSAQHPEPCRRRRDTWVGSGTIHRFTDFENEPWFFTLPRISLLGLENGPLVHPSHRFATL